MPSRELFGSLIISALLIALAAALSLSSPAGTPWIWRLVNIAALNAVVGMIVELSRHKMPSLAARIGNAERSFRAVIVLSLLLLLVIEVAWILLIDIKGFWAYSR